MKAPSLTPRSSPQADKAPRRAGGYEVLLDVGRGGMGSIQLARSLGEDAGAVDFERLVAIKRAHAFVLTDEAAAQRFLGEARLAARVHHANVVGIHRVGRDEDGPFIVLDYVEGDTLDALVDYASLRRQPLPPPIVLRIVADALAGLHAAHETLDSTGRSLGVLHRDIAPQNLLVGVDGVTRLADFGIAQEAATYVDADDAYLVGRLPFLSPEYLGRAPVDRRIDVYAMGITAWFALVGRMPWSESTEAELVDEVLRVGVPSMSGAGLTIAPPIEAIVAKACARDREARYPTARAMLEDIEEVGRQTGWLANHGEVAEVVQKLAGGDLAARRARLAGMARRDEPAGSTRWSVARELPSGAPRRRTATLGAAAAALALAGGVAVASRASSRPTAALAHAAATSASAVASAVPAPAPVVSASASEAPPAPSATEPPPPRATASAPRPRAAAKPTARPAPKSAPREASAITTANPYRR